MRVKITYPHVPVKGKGDGSYLDTPKGYQEYNGRQGEVTRTKGVSVLVRLDGESKDSFFSDWYYLQLV